MTAVATGSMDKPRYRPRCARAQPRSRSEGRQQRGGPATMPTPPKAAETAGQISATGGPGDGRDHVAATGSAGKEARLRTADDGNHAWHKQPGAPSEFPAAGWLRWPESAIERWQQRHRDTTGTNGEGWLPAMPIALPVRVSLYKLSLIVHYRLHHRTTRTHVFARQSNAGRDLQTRSGWQVHALVIFVSTTPSESLSPNDGDLARL
jgi:hypothetical protein